MLRVSILSLMIFLIATCLFAEEVYEYEAQNRRDPFVPLVSERGLYTSDAYGIGGIGDIRLEGIVWDDAEVSIAIVNGEIVEEGQEIGSVKVLKIEKDAVVFEVEREEVRIELSTD